MRLAKKQHANGAIDVQTRERIGQRLRDYYRACATEELPPQLLTLLKKLNQELPEEQDQ